MLGSGVRISYAPPKPLAICKRFFAAVHSHDRLKDKTPAGRYLPRRKKVSSRSANEARSFASVSVAKRLCRIVRPHGACACGASWRKCKQYYYFRCVPPHPLHCVQYLFPRGGGFHSYAFSSCMADIINYRNQPLPFLTPNHCLQCRQPV